MSIKRIKKVCYEFRHYFIATACVLILLLVLLLFFVFPYYYQNVKLRFMDKATNSPIVNTKFVIYKFRNSNLQPSKSTQYIKLVKTDAQGYIYLNTGYIKEKHLIIKNEDYCSGIDISKKQKRKIYFLDRNALKYRIAKDIKAFDDILRNVHTLEKFKEHVKKHNLKKSTNHDIK